MPNLTRESFTCMKTQTMHDDVAKVVYERFVFQEFCREQKWTNPRVVGLEKELQSVFCSCRLLEF